LNIHACWQVHLHFMNKSNCKPNFQYQPNVKACMSMCSKIWYTYQQFLHHYIIGHVNEVTMQLPLLQLNAHWILQVLFNNYYCSISEVYYRFHQMLITIHLDSILNHKLLIYVLLVLQKNYFLFGNLYVKLIYLLIQNLTLNYSKLYIRFFLNDQNMSLF
jgi:hypothetical protein